MIQRVKINEPRRFRKRNWVALTMINIFGELDDKEVYNSFPMFMTFCKSLEETMVFRWLYIRAVRDIATHRGILHLTQIKLHYPDYKVL